MTQLSKALKVFGYGICGVLAVTFIVLLIAIEISHNSTNLKEFFFLFGWFICVGFLTALFERIASFRFWPVVAPFLASLTLLIFRYLVVALTRGDAPPGHAPIVNWGYSTFVYSCVGFFPSLFSFYWLRRRLLGRSSLRCAP